MTHNNENKMDYIKCNNQHIANKKSSIYIYYININSYNHIGLWPCWMPKNSYENEY